MRKSSDVSIVPAICWQRGYSYNWKRTFEFGGFEFLHLASGVAQHQNRPTNLYRRVAFTKVEPSDDIFRVVKLVHPHKHEEASQL